METGNFWEKTTAAGKEAAVCVGAGVGAWFLALFTGAEEGIALFCGLIVFGGLAAVALWVWAQAQKEKGRAIGVNFGTAVMAVCGLTALAGMLFFSEWLMYHGFWGLLAGLAITVISAMPRHPEK